MKFILALLALMPLTSFSADVTLLDWGTTVPDILNQGVTKEQLYSEMNTDFIKINSSVCSNRAHVWAYDMKRFHRVEPAKIFLFYTGVSGRVGRKTWWYHVSPVVNEGGTLWTLDSGFENQIMQPLHLQEWLQEFVGTSQCKEIRASDTDLINRMFYGQVFPGVYNGQREACYYMVTPAGYWTPASVASAVFGTDQNGRRGDFARPTFDGDELMQACKEATTTRLGGFFGGSSKACEKYLGFRR
jgi:hypothetical protein